MAEPLAGKYGLVLVPSGKPIRPAVAVLHISVEYGDDAVAGYVLGQPFAVRKRALLGVLDSPESAAWVALNAAAAVEFDANVIGASDGATQAQAVARVKLRRAARAAARRAVKHFYDVATRWCGSPPPGD